MKFPLRTRVGFLLVAAGIFGFAATVSSAQSLYFINKSQNFLQTSSAAPVADPNTPFEFSVQAAGNVTFTLPAGGTVPLVFSADNQDYELDQTFASKTAIDTAFPSGTYKMTGTGIPAISFNLTTDLYPTVTPQVTGGGTWNAGGMLVVDPTQTVTITFNTFTGYATSGVGGHMQTRVQGLFDSVRLPPGNDSGILSVANPFGIPVQTTPLTTITIPARTLNSGGVYQASVQFDTASTFDTTTVSGSGIIALYEKSLSFYIAAQAPGTSTPLPVIIGQPANVVGVLGGTATFNLGVTVGGAAPTGNLQILWSFNGQQIDFSNSTKYGINGGSLVVRNLTNADVGSYTATLINAGGIVTTNPASLTLAVAAAPVITRQPVSATVTQGSTVVFSVGATGTPAPTYQWRFNGNNIPTTTNASANGPIFVIQGVNSAQAGSYSVVVTNSAGNATSNSVTLASATNFGDPGRLSNLSVLTDISAAVPSFTLGTVVGGGGTSGTKPLVVRAGGPGLGALGVPGVILDPKVDLFVGQTVVATNDNWGTPVGAGAASATDITTAMASVGAFAFPAGSKDAAIYGPAFGLNNYTVSVSGVGGATGTVIAEIYDGTPAGTFNATTPRLINVSVLKTINNGGSITLGFTIGGTSAKTILIRAIGPGLAVITGTTNGTVPDPQLTLFNSSSVAIGTNDDWGGNPAIVNVGNRVNAFSIGNNPTKDSMLLVTLPPGGYTAQASGVGGTGGLVIVEAYEVP